METVPRELEKYMTRDEVIEASFRLSNCRVWATNKRLFVKMGRRIQDIDYRHISSIGFENKKYYNLIALGIVLFILDWIFSNAKAPNQMIALIAFVGILCIILGIFLKKEWLELVVLGFTTPLKFEGGKEELDMLLKIIRDKRVI